MKICRGTTFSRLVLRHVFMCGYEKSCFRVILVQSKILFSVTVGIIDMKRKLYDSLKCYMADTGLLISHSFDKRDCQ